MPLLVRHPPAESIDRPLVVVVEELCVGGDRGKRGGVDVTENRWAVSGDELSRLVGERVLNHVTCFGERCVIEFRPAACERSADPLWRGNHSGTSPADESNRSA
ncbi:MAG: hypothetical protein V5A38_07080 [Halolamina sp.]|uniref:hypothetical protein n=1 Tax=Halolamina sp. TaxID=1940283 RepID=UPI002FC357E2